eukprot:4405484-Pleurochrysis_carterae.AAC.4
MERRRSLFHEDLYWSEGPAALSSWERLAIRSPGAVAGTRWLWRCGSSYQAGRRRHGWRASRRLPTCDLRTVAHGMRECSAGMKGEQAWERVRLAHEGDLTNGLIFARTRSYNRSIDGTPDYPETPDRMTIYERARRAPPRTYATIN